MLAGRKQIQPTVWVQYCDGFEVELRYLPRVVTKEMLDGARQPEWAGTKLAGAESFGESKYREALAHRGVVNWRGLDADILKKFVLLDEEDLPAAEVPFSVEDCVWLMKEASAFELWVQRLCCEVEVFQVAAAATPV